MSKKVGLRNFSAISRLKALASVVETFLRANSASLGKTDSGATWSNVRGSWGIVSNAASSTDAASGYPLATLNFSKEDVTLIAKGVGPGVGTAFWVTDSNNWWGTYVDTEQTCQTCSSGGNCSTYGTVQNVASTCSTYGTVVTGGGNCSTYGTQCNANNTAVYGVTSYTGGNCATYGTQCNANTANYGCTANNATVAAYGCTSSSANYGCTANNALTYGVTSYSGGTCAGYGVSSYSGGNCASYNTVYYSPTCGVTGYNAYSYYCASYYNYTNTATCGSYSSGCIAYGTLRYYAGKGGYNTNCNSYSIACAAYNPGNTAAGCLSYGITGGTSYCVVYYSSGGSGPSCASYNATSAAYGCTSTNVTVAVNGVTGGGNCSTYGVVGNTCNANGVVSYSGGNCSTYGAVGNTCNAYGTYCASSNATAAVYGVTTPASCSTYGTVCNANNALTYGTQCNANNTAVYGTQCNATNPVVYSSCNCVNNDKVKIVKNVAGTITTVATLAFASTIAGIKTVLSGNSVTVSAYSDTSATTQIGSSQATTISGQTKSKVHGILKGVVTYGTATSTIDQFEVS